MRSLTLLGRLGAWDSLPLLPGGGTAACPSLLSMTIDCFEVGKCSSGAKNLHLSPRSRGEEVGEELPKGHLLNYGDENPGSGGVPFDLVPIVDGDELSRLTHGQPPHASSRHEARKRTSGTSDCSTCGHSENQGRSSGSTRRFVRSFFSSSR